MSFAVNVPLTRQNQIFWCALFLLVVVSSLALAASNRLVSAYNNSQRSHQALLALDAFLSSLKDIETGARGYAFTGDQRFLQAYQDGRRNLGETVRDLRSLQRSEKPLVGKVVPLERLAEQRQAQAEEVIRLTGAHADKSSVLRATINGKQTMDEARRLVATTRVEQQKSYDTRRKKAAGEALIASLALAAGVATSLLILAWLFKVLKREVRRREVVEGEFRDLNASLEQRIQVRTAEVEQSRRLLDAIVENIPDTVFLKDADDGFKYVLMNRAGEQLAGRTREEFLGHVDHDLYPSEIADFRRAEDEGVAAAGMPVVLPEQSLATDHGERTIEVRKIPVTLDGDGRMLILGIVRDVTNQRDLESKIREMQRLESVGLLTGGIAHDFNNLLAIIMGSVELIQQDLPAGSQAADIAGEAIEAVNRGAELVRRLLAFARKQHLEPTAVDLNDRMRNVVPLLERSLGEHIEVKVHHAEQLWLAQIDATQVDDALVNLAINGRDAMPQGGVLVIETSNVVLDADYAAHHAEVEPGEYVVLAVSDTGTGMDSATVERAFEPFFTTKPEGKGTGLGLPSIRLGQAIRRAHKNLQ